MAVAEPGARTESVTDEHPQCWRCKRTLAEYLTRPWSLRCRRCHALNQSAPDR
jgi:hypothetical protein